MSLIQIQRPESRLAALENAPRFHLVRGKHPVWFAVEGSRMYLAEDQSGAAEAPDEIGAFAVRPPAAETAEQPAALSLNIAQSCNLACAYCYADEGRFGGASKLMTLETAKEAIRRHIRDAASKVVSVGFIGGEPLLNREVLHEATRFAAREAASRGIAVTFGITTNGTLLRAEDIELLRRYTFAVTVSLDGAQESHDQLRPARDGRGSFARAVQGIAPLLARPGNAWVAARVTVTRKNMDVAAHIEALAAAGFPEVGVSPMRTGPEPALRLAGDDWIELLARLKEAAQADWQRARATGGRLRFSNFSTALRQLYRGAYNALPCGAAASYVSLSADGAYYTCHRTIGAEGFRMGDLENGLSLARRAAFTAERAVDRQEPCRSCWARYLCGGGCHAEVIQSGREGCDAIRGWLEFCISIYPEVLAQRPDLLEIQRHAAFGGRLS